MPHRFLLLFPISIALFSSCQNSPGDKFTELSSPDKKLEIQLFAGNGSSVLHYSLRWKDSLLVDLSPIGIDLEGEQFDQLSIKNIQRFEKDSLFSPVIASKRKIFRDHYSAILINFDQPLSLEVRMYNEGLAFRWVGRSDTDLKIFEETFEVNPTGESQLFYAPYEQEIEPGRKNFLIRERERIKGLFQVSYPYENHFETKYQHDKISELREKDHLFAPVLLQSPGGKYLVVAESDVVDYPGMILRKSSQNGVKTDFAPFPLKEEIPVDTMSYWRLKKVSKIADYIAFTKGKRTFPWRVIMVTDNPADIPASDLVLKLASPSTIQGDVTWIKPGQITDEWLVGVNLFNVPFASGKNTASYKYYIDFAKQFGIEYIMVDEGWYLNGNLKKLNKNVNLDSISVYAREKGIGLGLWFNATDLEESLEENLAKYSALGVKVLLIDFINRNDQKAMNFYVKIAEACARHKMMVNLHSAPAPAGFEITYPHAITREAVMGSEWNGWSKFVTPNHNLTIPFTRMFSGSLDYEPGLLDNSKENGFRNIDGQPMSQGTRAHQLAMYVIYDNPLQYFVGNPSQGFLEPEFMNFLGSIPTTWDETIVLEGKPAEYIVTARLKDGIWYLGAMSNWTERVLTIDLSNLGLTQFNLTGITDGVNSNNYASDYQFISRKGITDQILTVQIGKGGGGVWRLEPQKLTEK
jgi:alpha-glucosidase